MPSIRRTGKRPFPPRVSAFTRPFWDALAEGWLITTGCSRCSRLRLMCRLLGEPERFAPEAPVEMIVAAYDDGPLFAARPVG